MQRDARVRGNVTIPRARYVASAAPLLPTLVRLHLPFRGFRQQEMKRVLYLTTLERMLSGAATHRDEIRVLDEGPVYMLARMLYFNERLMTDAAFRRWWGVAASRWARVLDAVVWLDADTAILARRIRERPGRPPVSDTRDAHLLPFLRRYRRCYSRVMHDLAVFGGPLVVHIDSGRMPVDVIAQDVLHAVYSRTS